MEQPHQVPGPSGSHPNEQSDGNATTAPKKPRISIPSYREVQESLRPNAPTIFFRPTGLAAQAMAQQSAPLGTTTAAAPPQQQQQPFFQSAPPSATPTQPHHNYMQPPGPNYLHQQQQQNHHHPYQQQQQQQQPPYLHQQTYQPRPLYPSSAPPFTSMQQVATTTQPPPPPPPPTTVAVAAAEAPNPHAITVSRRQQGNPVLKYIRNVRWQYGDILPDYLLGQATAALFLSLRYHLLKPNYVHTRMKELGRAYRLRVLLVHVDTEDAVEPLAQVTRAAIGNDFTLLCGFSNAECARYLETLKSYEKKPAEIIQKDLGTDYVSRATAALTAVRGVNKTDVKTLGDRFGSMAAVMQVTEAELKACPGIGPVKARRLFETFHEPFRRTLVVAPASATVRLLEQQPQPQNQQQAVVVEEEPVPVFPLIEQVLTADGDENEEEEDDEDGLLLL